MFCFFSISMISSSDDIKQMQAKTFAMKFMDKAFQCL